MKKANSLLLIITGLFLLFLSSFNNGKHGIKNPNDTGVNDLFIYDVINKTNKQLTHTSDTIEYISTFFHHRQTFLYFTNDGIYSMNVDGSKRARLLSPGYYFDLSSDDQTIVYVNNGGLLLANPDWSNPRKLIHDQISYLVPKWAPDRQKIACIDTNLNLHLVTLDGNSKLLINGLDWEFNWSPDSRTLVYNKRSGSKSIIYKYDLVTQAETLLTPSVQYAFSPVFNPVNSKICFLSVISNATESGYDLMIMNADGSGQHSILHQKVMSPCWSPDGTRIAFKLDGNVAICNADGTGLQVINEKKGHCSELLWSPDGRYILYPRRIQNHHLNPIVFDSIPTN